jgi:hypothetical protein
VIALLAGPVPAFDRRFERGAADARRRARQR